LLKLLLEAILLERSSSAGEARRRVRSSVLCSAVSLLRRKAGRQAGHREE